MKKIVKINIGFENCESIDINIKDIEVSATGIKQSLYTHWYNNGAFDKLLKYSAKFVVFNIKHFYEYKPGKSNDSTYLLKSDHIVDFTIHFNDKTTFTCYVPWNKKGQYTNKYQSNVYDEIEDILHIIICKNYKKITKNYENSIMARRSSKSS